MSRMLDVVLCWHFHQPEYREPLSAQYQESWTYLHAIKDYVDMAGHLEAHPDVRVVVNFTPLLLEQIGDYVKQIDQYKSNQAALRDPLLAALVSPVLSVDADQQIGLIKQCLRANQKHLIARFPHYQKLVEMAHWMTSRRQSFSYISDQFVTDLVVWYHLAWIGETERERATIVRLSDKGAEFDLTDRLTLFDLVAELLNELIPRYIALAQRGQVELSTSPYSHPILPLMIDMQSAHQASPDLALPPNRPYCGGEHRAAWQLQRARSVFEQAFGCEPSGCWPSEGAICEHSLNIIEQAGFDWVASGGNVLKNSSRKHRDDDHSFLHKRYQLNNNRLSCFFRDDHLSDLIGFTYSDWHADDAVSNLISELERLHTLLEPDDAVVSIILDGENAWEYYPRNGYYFLDELYRQLAESSAINLITFSEACAKPAAQLRELVAGSWVYGTLTTWIGDEQKNHAWDLLCDAKRVFDQRWPMLDHATKLKAEQQLAICEGSDWFWWFGDYNPSEAVELFDALFRTHLAHLYQCLNVTPPESLAIRFAHGCGAPEHGGVMRHGEI